MVSIINHFEDVFVNYFILNFNTNKYCEINNELYADELKDNNIKLAKLLLGKYKLQFITNKNKILSFEFDRVYMEYLLEEADNKLNNVLHEFNLEDETILKQEVAKLFATENIDTNNIVDISFILSEEKKKNLIAIKTKDNFYLVYNVNNKNIGKARLFNSIIKFVPDFDAV